MYADLSYADMTAVVATISFACAEEIRIVAFFVGTIAGRARIAAIIGLGAAFCEISSLRETHPPMLLLGIAFAHLANPASSRRLSAVQIVCATIAQLEYVRSLCWLCWLTRWLCLLLCIC